MSSESADKANLSELLQSYQSSVVHDLRGDLNGLLLTLDFLRRQLSSRPETATLFGDSLGDLDHVRTTLTRTLNQLEAVGHARRVVGGRDTPSTTDQNLADVVAEVVQTLSERVRRRNVTIGLPQDRDVVVKTDSVLLHLLLHRIASSLIELSKNGELRFSVGMVQEKPNTAFIRAWVPDDRVVPPDLFDKAAAVGPSSPQPVPPTVMAVALASKLAEQLRGTIRKETAEDGSYAIVLELPA
jgi:K+-sensing histidine kinase KdpD